MPDRVISNRDPKRCTTCKVEKPLSAFYPIRTKRGRPVLVLLYMGRCKACMIAKAQARIRGPKRAEVLAYKKRHYAQLRVEGRANLGWKDRHFANAYNTTQTAYDVQFLEQGGRCAICLREMAVGEKRFAYDHDHGDGQVRGVLCPACNGGLGCFRDNAELLKAAIAYLAYWRARHVGEEVCG